MADALPSDVLLFIFRFIPLRALLIAVRCVCKRWNNIAPRSVQALPEVSDKGALALYGNVALVQQFVNVTSWRMPHIRGGDTERCVGLTAAVAPWIGKLRSLDMSGVELDHPLLLLMSQLTSLTTAAPSHCCPHIYSQFISQNASSLVAIKFYATYKSVFPVSLPYLQSLFIPSDGAYGTYAFERTFLANHMSTLTTLHVPSVSIHMFSTPAPNLRTLILGMTELGNHAFQQWYESLTSLTASSLQFDDCPLTQLVSFKPHTITGLSIRNPATLALTEAGIPILRLCTQLRSLSFRQELSLKTRHFQEIQQHILTEVGSQLESLSGVIVAPEILASCCPALTSLKIVAVAVPTDYLLSLQLPCLRTLIFDTSRSSSPGASSACLLHVLTAMPTLRTVEICLANNSTMSVKVDAVQLEDHLRTAEHNGMERVSLRLTRPFPPPTAFLQAWSRMQRMFTWINLSNIPETH